jgi:hypothetical protein
MRCQGRRWEDHEPHRKYKNSTNGGQFSWSGSSGSRGGRRLSREEPALKISCDIKFPALVNSAQGSTKINFNRRFDGVQKGKGDKIMKRIGTTLSILVLAGSLAGSAFAAGGILSKDSLADENYCHMKFPAIRPSTLGTDHPELKRSDTGDVIDFYGSCDESPTGPGQVAAQKLNYEQSFDQD